MHAHVPVPPGPIKCRCHNVSDRRAGGVFAQDVNDLTAVAVNGGGDGGGKSVRTAKHSGVARLAPAGRVEDAAVKHDTAPAVHLKDRCIAALLIRIRAKEFLGGRHGMLR